jgi:transposase
MKKLFVIGIDVSKDKLDVFFHTSSKHFIVPNSPNGYRELLKVIVKDEKQILNDVLICFENTGKYSKQLSVFLEASNIKFHMSPAIAIKRSLGLVRGKNDKVDSKRIALYAYEKIESLELTKLPGYKIDQIKSLLTLREKFIRHRTAYKNDMKDVFDCYKEGETKLLRDMQLELIDKLTEKISIIEKEILTIIKSDESMYKNYNLINTIKGLAKINAFYFIAFTENFTAFSNAKKFACYSGIAPFPYSSGTIKGKDRVHCFGNKRMKSILDLAAKSSIRYGEFKAYYNRRVNELGKNKMSTINIIRNKIVARVFAVVKRGTPYVDLYKFAA